MKIKRYKKVKKGLSFYVDNFGFREPYQILVDGNFCYAALNNKVNISDNIPRYLKGEVKLLTTQCIIMEMENLGKKLGGALLVLKQYTVHKCGHEGKPVPGAKCILSMMGKRNQNHYILATQDRDLQDKVRGIPGVPLLYLHMKTPVLEHPSPVSVDAAKNKYHIMEEAEKKKIEELKKQMGLVKEETRVKRKKKKGPNPLSCKKKQKKPHVQNSSINKKEGDPEVEKKKRKRVRIPKHVLEELLKSKQVDDKV